MKKYLVFAFLIGFTPLSFFHEAKAMEEMDVDREETSVNPVSRKQLRYVVSPEKDANPLSNYELRTLHPINDLYTAGNLDKVLYQTAINSEELKYNPSLESVKKVLETLKTIAKKDGFLHSKIEKDALAHLFPAAISLIDSTNGMENDREYGSSLMRWYFEETQTMIDNNLRIHLEKLSKDTTYSATDFIGCFQIFKCNLTIGKLYDRINTMALIFYEILEKKGMGTGYNPTHLADEKNNQGDL